ncbi:thioredoxin [Candidatus Woesearchaeota archaeon]|nr:MAG: thioredoxin [Candidatus Woesearchaeota archaeon]
MVNIVELDEENFREEVIGAKRPVVVDWYANWCMPCMQIKPIFEEIASEFRGRVKFCKINVEENKKIAGYYDIRGIPCIIIFKDGKEIGRIIGFEGKELLKQKIESHLGDIAGAYEPEHD